MRVAFPIWLTGFDAVILPRRTATIPGGRHHGARTPRRLRRRKASATPMTTGGAGRSTRSSSASRRPARRRGRLAVRRLSPNGVAQAAAPGAMPVASATPSRGSRAAHALCERGSVARRLSERDGGPDRNRRRKPVAGGRPGRGYGADRNLTEPEAAAGRSRSHGCSARQRRHEHVGADDPAQTPGRAGRLALAIGEDSGTSDLGVGEDVELVATFPSRPPRRPHRRGLPETSAACRAESCAGRRGRGRPRARR